MRRFIISVFLFSLSFFKVFGQNLEAGGAVGIINYQGDLADGYLVLHETHPAFGFHLRHFIDNRSALRLTYWYGNISGKDANSKSATLRARNYSFSSALQEVTVQYEFNLSRKRSRNGPFKSYIVPFASIGAGAAFVPGTPTVPQNAIEDPFPEVGDKNNFFCLPVGVGLRWFVSKQFVLSGEIGSRTVFSDYLDGVSKKGNADKSDWYVISAVSFSYFFNTSPNMCSGW